MQRVQLSPLIARKFTYQELAILRADALVSYQTDVTNNENDEQRIFLAVCESISKEKCCDHVKLKRSGTISLKKSTI